MRETEDAPGRFGPEFEILRELGRGGVSVVYLARDRMLGRQVAIKVIDDRFVGDTEALTRFRREAQLLAQLQHPNIVPIHAAKRLADGRVALVMQHMEGPTLRELIRREGPLPCGRAERVLRDVAEALAYLHRRGIVHRDVKPENIYVEPDGDRAFLSDFGIAKPTDGEAGLTMTGVVLGTPTYMSPEQIDGAWLNGQSDLYSLGLVGWEMLTGQRPWGGEALYTIIYKQKNEYLPPVEQLRPETPERLREAVNRALFKDRALRWANAEAFLQQVSGPAPADLPVPRDAAPPVPALVAPLQEEDVPTQMLRPAAAIGEVWRETVTATQQRTHVRRRRTATLAVAATLTLGGLTAAAALFATMRGDERFESFVPSVTAEPQAAAATRPARAGTTPAPAPVVGAPAEPGPAIPPPAAAPTTSAAESPVRAAASGRTGRREPASEQVRRRRPTRSRAGSRTRPTRRTTPGSTRAATPASRVEEPAPQPVLVGEPKLLGRPVNEIVRTDVARSGRAEAARGRDPATRPRRR